MSQAQAAQIEYTIYTFDMPTPKQKADNSWKKHATLDDMSRAMQEAENLHQTQKFQKVEVKKKFFDQKKNRIVDMTLKTFETKPKKDFTILIAAVAAILLGAGAFAASFFLSR
jgi:tRNA U38,U39,U40 pseudouridine synthase TruA